MARRVEKYLASCAVLSLTCAQALLAESADTSAACSQENDRLFAGLLYIPPDSENGFSGYNLKPPSSDPDDANRGLLYIPSAENADAKEKEKSSEPDDLSPSLFYIPSESANVPVCEQSNPPSMCALPSRRGSLSGGFLYWFGKQNGLDYTNGPQSVLTTSNFTDSSLLEPDFRWKPGLQLAADYGLDRSLWSCGLNFIYYHGMTDGHKSAKDNQGIFPILSFSDTTLPSDYVTSAEVKWRLSTAILDADINYEWNCSSWLSLVPSLALRNVWIHEKVRADYEGGTFNAGSDVVRLKSHFFGIGPLLGLMPKFIFSRHCYAYGEASVSYLWGSFDVRQQETFLSTTTAFFKKNRTGNRWNGNFSGGLVFSIDWRKGFWGLKHLDVDLGADYLFFTRQYPFTHGVQFSLSKRDKTLKLYGIHISLGAHF